jgi:hypothetical protein
VTGDSAPQWTEAEYGVSHRLIFRGARALPPESSTNESLEERRMEEDNAMFFLNDALRGLWPSTALISRTCKIQFA